MNMYFKNINEYADKNNITRQSASRHIKDGTAKLIAIPKGVKYIDINELIKYLLKTL